MTRGSGPSAGLLSWRSSCARGRACGQPLVDADDNARGSLTIAQLIAVASQRLSQWQLVTAAAAAAKACVRDTGHELSMRHSLFVHLVCRACTQHYVSMHFARALALALAPETGRRPGQQSSQSQPFRNSDNLRTWLCVCNAAACRRAMQSLHLLARALTRPLWAQPIMCGDNASAAFAGAGQPMQRASLTSVSLSCVLCAS